MNEIIHTLVIKDLKSRFYGDRLSYVWDLINPLAWIGALIVFFTCLQKQVPIYTDIISFLIPGMLAYILFRNTVRSIMRTKKTSQTILLLPSINPHILIIAAGYLELLNSLVIFLVLISLNYVLFERIECHDILVMIYGYFCAWGTGLALGGFSSVLSDKFLAFEKILPLLLRPIFWISGVFYTANELPEWLAKLAAMNPLFQAIEIIRDGTFLSYHSRMALYYQPILSIIGIVIVTLLIKASQNRAMTLN